MLVLLLSLWSGRVATAQAGLTKAEIRLFRAVNYARTSRGLHRLRIGSTLQTGSHSWATYLRRHDAFYHGRLALGTAENIGWLTCRRRWSHTLVRMWLNSPAHREHLLDPSFRRIGVGVSRGSWSSYSCVDMGVTRFR
jgi:uncharacterized protein YkwD